MDTKTCRFCAEEIKAAATVCRYCRRSQDAQQPQPRTRLGFVDYVSAAIGATLGVALTAGAIAMVWLVIAAVLAVTGR